MAKKEYVYKTARRCAEKKANGRCHRYSNTTTTRRYNPKTAKKYCEEYKSVWSKKRGKGVERCKKYAHY